MSMKLFTGLAVAVAASSGAQAADMARPAPVAVMPTMLPAFSWGGAYVGASLGYGRSNTDWTDVDGWYGSGTSGLKNGGVVFGAYAGYNFIINPMLLVGVEADFSYNTGDDKFTLSSEPAYITSDANFLGTVRARLGMTFDRTLIYATGGLAFGNPQADWYEYSGAAWRQEGWKVGYTIGAGAEYALTNNVLLRLEGLYYNLGKKSAKQTGSDYGYGYNDGYRMKTKTDGFVVRAGIAYKF